MNRAFSKHVRPIRAATRAIGLRTVALLVVLAGGAFAGGSHLVRRAPLEPVDQELAARLRELGFTGSIAATLETRLGRRIDNQLADLGRLLWFDTITGLNDDNACGGCHSPGAGFVIRSPSRSVSKTTGSSARTAPVRATSAARRWRSTRRSSRR